MTRFVLPAGIFVALLVLLAVGLTLDPREVPSPLIGKPAPEFRLARLHAPEQTIAREDLLGEVTLLNVWATWCVGCRQEHPLLVEIARQGYRLVGLNHKDERGPAIRWLERLGNPYAVSGFDDTGKVGIDYGVYGLPETFVIDPEGTIVHKHIGPLTPDAWEREIRPVVDRLRAGLRTGRG